jgi:alkanesulfonate monooxygenase SsuD/methylene tetrahydromethanopterin reductase-like flavin-dependent oxidoreductase (luciferase family)
MVRLAVLDLAPIMHGSDTATALRHTLDYARHAERLGIHRYWLAEHHNMPVIQANQPGSP